MGGSRKIIEKEQGQWCVTIHIFTELKALLVRITMTNVVC